MIIVYNVARVISSIKDDDFVQVATTKKEEKQRKEKKCSTRQQWSGIIKIMWEFRLNSRKRNDHSQQVLIKKPIKGNGIKREKNSWIFSENEKGWKKNEKFCQNIKIIRFLSISDRCERKKVMRISRKEKKNLIKSKNLLIHIKFKNMQKPCKTCWKNPRHPQRTECLACINRKQREKAREQLRKKKEKEKNRKTKKLENKRFSRQNLIKEADRVFSIYIRERDRGVPCITCWKSWEENHQCGHFMSRRHLATRWTEKNAHGQCPKCNMWGAGEQYLHALAIEKKYGEWTAERIKNLAESTDKVTDDEVLEVIRKYYRLLSEMAVEFSPKKYFLK